MHTEIPWSNAVVALGILAMFVGIAWASAWGNRGDGGGSQDHD
jgi:hypothetical protein